MMKLKRVFWIGWLFLMMMGWGKMPAQSAIANNQAGAFIPDQVVVKIDPLSGATIADINATYSTTTLVPLTHTTIYLLDVPNGTTAEQMVINMQGDVRLLWAELNYVQESPEISGSSIWGWGGEDDTPYDIQYAMNMLQIDQAHTINTGAGIVVAVIDTGVQLDHPALMGSLTTTMMDFVDGDLTPEDEFNGIDDDGDMDVDEAAGHGTHIAGIIHLTAPSAQIMPLRVLNSDGEGNIFALAEAIEFAVNNGAHVINLSLGLEDESDLVEDTIKWATKRGVFVVGAAGNNSSSAKHYPAASSCTVSVTGVDENEVKVSSANFGDWVHFAVPSKSIYSTFPPDGYAWWTGTSMATPFVAGQGALLLAENPLLTPREILFLAYGTAQSVDGSNPAHTEGLGAGLPQLHDSLLQLQTGTIPDLSGGLMPGSCVIQPPTISGEALSDDVRLTWQPNGDGVENYAVYRSTEAYFELNAGTLLTNALPPHRNNYHDNNILTGTSAYFYVMQGIGEEVVPSKESNRVGVFQFAMTP